MGISSVIIVNHSPDVSGVVPKIAKSSGVVVALCVMLMCLISKPSGEQCETFSNIL